MDKKHKVQKICSSCEGTGIKYGETTIGSMIIGRQKLGNCGWCIGGYETVELDEKEYQEHIRALEEYKNFQIEMKKNAEAKAEEQRLFSEYCKEHFKDDDEIKAEIKRLNTKLSQLEETYIVSLNPECLREICELSELIGKFGNCLPYVDPHRF